jgi:hypothetical protein
MKVSGEGYWSFAADWISTLRIVITFLLHRRQRRFIFRLPPTPERREGMPKG